MFDFIKKRKIVILVAIVIVVIVFVAIKVRTNSSDETISPVKGDLIRVVKISGKVVPTESVELSFEISGTVTSVTKVVGDLVTKGEIVARIDSSAVSSNILKSQAELTLAQAELEKLDGAGAYETQIENAKRVVIQTIIDAYTAANDAVHNKVDNFFLNPRSARPEVLPSLNSALDLKNSIIKNRVVMEETLENWSSLIGEMGASTYIYMEEDLSTAKKYFSEVSSFISDVSQAANIFENDAFLSQTVIDGYKSDAILAKDGINSSSQNLISAENKLRALLLEVPIQVARVESARASLLNSRSQFTKTTLISPIRGIVSKQDTKVGQVVSPNITLVSIISKELEIEAFIPEVLISGVRIDNSAVITLDAYRDQETFEARVSHIDPAETIRDGVSTYKIKLIFNQADARIRSGMTANINVETFKKSNVLLIPERTVVRENNETFVYILSGDKSEKTPVTLGSKDSSGNIELLSELPSESGLIINPPSY